MLTGKAKKDFYNWINDNGYHEEVVYKSVINCLITEWLDSVGIHVETGLYPNDYGDVSFSGTIFGKMGGWDDDIDHATRQQATEQAIIKANEMYNSQ